MSEDQQKSNLPNDSETLGTVRNTTEKFGTIPNNAEPFRTLRNVAERRENHSLTVREVARMFENAGVARTERSIINWCQRNKTGVARLDCYFDPNDRKYYVTPQSVELAIAEEKAKAAKFQQDSSEAPVKTIPERSELPPPKTTPSAPEQGGNSEQLKALRQEVIDLKIVNQGKNYFIDQLQKERQNLMDKLINASYKVGELETRLLLGGTRGSGTAPPDDLRV